MKSTILKLTCSLIIVVNLAACTARVTTSKGKGTTVKAKASTPSPRVTGAPAPRIITK